MGQDPGLATIKDDDGPEMWQLFEKPCQQPADRQGGIKVKLHYHGGDISVCHVLELKSGT